VTTCSTAGVCLAAVCNWRRARRLFLFRIDPMFKKSDVKNVTIEVDISTLSGYHWARIRCQQSAAGERSLFRCAAGREYRVQKPACDTFRSMARHFITPKTTGRFSLYVRHPNCASGVSLTRGDKVCPMSMPRQRLAASLPASPCWIALTSIVAIALGIAAACFPARNGFTKQRKSAHGARSS